MPLRGGSKAATSSPAARAAAVLCSAAVMWGLPAATHAQGADAWTFQGSLYLYLPTLGGKTTYPPSGGSTVSVDYDVLDNLKFTVMGTLEAHRGRWGVFTDLVYVDLGDHQSATRALTIGGVLPADVSADLEHDIRGWMWTLAGSWRAVSSPTYRLDLLGGTRMLDLKETLTWQLNGNVGSIALADRAGSRSAHQQHWDLIVGAKGRATFGDGGKWFVPYYLDLGTGESKFTWQAMAGVGYTFAWGDVVGAWRYVDYRMKSGQAFEQLSFNGPAVAAVFRW